VTCLRSPVIDLTSVSGAELTFAEALDLEAGDTAVVNIIEEATDNVIAAAIYTADDSGSTGDADWNDVPAIDLADGIGQKVRIEWCLTGGTAEYLGWYIDDVQVTATSAAAGITIKNLTDATETSITASDSSQVSIVGNVLTVTPDTGFETSTAYAIQIGASAITDLSGNPFAGILDDTTWNFTTGTFISIFVDEASFEGAKALGGWVNLAGDPVSAEPGSSTASVPGAWVLAGGQGTGWTDTSQYSGGIPDGDIYAYMNAAGNISQTLVATLQADTTYTLTVAVGWRADLPGFGFPTFPGYGVELWAGGVLLASDYDAGHGGTGAATPAGDEWKDAVITYTSPSSVTADPLEIRLIGYGIQTNYDHVRLTSEPGTGGGDTFANWISGFNVGAQTGLDDDPDGDGNDSGVENFFGTAPDAFSQGLISGTVSGGTFTFTHPQGTLVSDLSAAYQWSKDLSTFNADGATDGEGTKVDFTVQPDTPAAGTTTVTATVTGIASAKLFVNVLVTQN